MAVTFLLAACERPGERHWLWWGLGNLLLVAAIIGHMCGDLLPATVRFALPNGLAVAGFGLRWCAAREFGGRARPLAIVFAPAVLVTALRLLPDTFAVQGAISAGIDLLLTAFCAATAWEFFRDRNDGLPSRYGLVLAYGVATLSIGVRLLQSLVYGRQIALYFDDDAMLTMHLLVVLFFTVTSGSFALSLAYERNARHLKAVAMHDSLTGLLNRRAFDVHLRGLLANPVCGGFAVMVFDIDHFKLVNDRYGHAAGDAALRTCAAICRALMPEHGLIARVGGEEFAAVLRHVTREEALATAERIREAVKATPMSVGDTRFRLTISVGMCHSSSGIDDFDELMRRADAGLYAAKHKGRDRVERIGEDRLRSVAPVEEAPANGDAAAAEQAAASSAAPAISLRAG